MEVETHPRSVPASVFRRLVMELIIKEDHGGVETVSSAALAILQEISEDYVVEKLRDGYTLAEVAGRNTLHPIDLANARMLSNRR